jgi:hypothetical protein
MRIFCYILLVGILFSSCDNEVHIERLTDKELQTKHIFDVSIKDIQFSITKAFGNFNYRNMSLMSGKENDLFPDSTRLLLQLGNENDFGLTSYGRSIGKAQNYLANGDSVNYYVGFHIHLTKTDSFRTSVEVKAIHPRIPIGKTYWPETHGTALKYKEIESSTVEENEILQIITNSIFD